MESLVHKSKYPHKPMKHVNFMPNKIQKTHHIYSSLPSMQPINKESNTGIYKSTMNIQLDSNKKNNLKGKRGGIIYSSLNNLQTAPLTRSPNVTLNKFKESLQNISNNQSISKRQAPKSGIQIDIKTKCLNQPLQQQHQQQQQQQKIQSKPQRQSINITNKGPPIKYIGVSIGDSSRNRHTGVLISTSNNINNKLLNTNNNNNNNNININNNNNNKNNKIQSNSKIVNIQLREEKLPKKSILKKSTSIKMNSNLNYNKENLKPKTTTTTTTTTTTNSMKTTTTQFKSTTKIKSDFSKLMNIDLEQELKSFHSNKSTPLNTSYNYLTSNSSTTSLSCSSSTSSYDNKFKRIDKSKITTNTNSSFNTNLKRHALIINNNNNTKLKDFTNRLY
jgi:hypothetical protein